MENMFGGNNTQIYAWFPSLLCMRRMKTWGRDLPPDASESTYTFFGRI